MRLSASPLRLRDRLIDVGSLLGLDQLARQLPGSALTVRRSAAVASTTRQVIDRAHHERIRVQGGRRRRGWRWAPKEEHRHCCWVRRDRSGYVCCWPTTTGYPRGITRALYGNAGLRRTLRYHLSNRRFMALRPRYPRAHSPELTKQLPSSKRPGSGRGSDSHAKGQCNLAMHVA